MRPVRLEFEGFTAFRDHTVVDFEGADLFALTGATGSGKTSVLDAVVFALYGVVPRLADQRQVAPAISQGLAEAKVGLDFLVGGARYTAVRVVRRTKQGASTAEARLEGPAGVLAGTADEVSAEVQRLLGLSYDHFTKCVVLPQGEFARFLHDKPKDRQDLLVSLLDLGVFEAMRGLARRRQDAADREAAGLEGRLGELSDATPDAVEAAEARWQQLAALLGEVEAALPALAERTTAEAAARAEAKARAADAALVDAIAVPADVGALSRAAEQAAAEVAARVVEVTTTEAVTEAAELALRALPTASALDAVAADLRLREGNVAQRGKGEAALAERQATLDAASVTLAAAEARVEEAKQGSEEAAAAHRAHAVRADVVIGEPCPVCAHVVTALPDDAVPIALAATRAATKLADADLAKAAAAQRDAAAEVARVEGKLATIVAELERIEIALAGKPTGAALDAQAEAVAAAGAALEAARSAEKVARQAEVAARTRVETAAGAVELARAAFDVTRDAVASLGPPARAGDLAADWAALAAWATTAGAELRAAAAAASAAADEAAASAAAARLAMVARCGDAGLDLSAGGDLRTEVVDAVARAGAANEAMAKRAADATTVRAELVEVSSRRKVAASLAVHLDAKHFEKWVLDEALVSLADGATDLLRSLSGGQYSLRIDSKTGGFLVVDHRNADEPRSARTLSGGETFLASLALALALADRITTLASEGAARLDAIFLDEGFGTLDPDTLDVVASAIEELGASGRMVGVVSHVAELAERVPVRFEVTRVGNASSVVRVDR